MAKMREKNLASSVEKRMPDVFLRLETPIRKSLPSSVLATESILENAHSLVSRAPAKIRRWLVSFTKP